MALRETYEIITDKVILTQFIEGFLPELEENECYYLCLFARSKYAKNEDGSNKFPHISTDKSQLKRFTATKKSNIIDKIRQLEVPVGAFKTKHGEPVPQESLALYITPNPRKMDKALFTLSRALLSMLETQGKGYNIHQEALSAIQKSRSKARFIDMDIDTKDLNIDDKLKELRDLIGDSFNVLETRGGYHILARPQDVVSEFKNWYPKMFELFAGIIDKTSNPDAMIPVPGTFQGGFTPRFIEP